MWNKILDFKVPWYVGVIVFLIGFFGFGAILVYVTQPVKPWEVKIELKELILEVESIQAVTPMILSDEEGAYQEGDEWSFCLNKEAVSQVKDGTLVVRLQIGDFLYDATEVDGNKITIKTGWTSESSRTTAGLFNKITGRYVSSFVITSGSTAHLAELSKVTDGSTQDELLSPSLESPILSNSGLVQAVDGLNVILNGH